MNLQAPNDRYFIEGRSANNIRLEPDPKSKYVCRPCLGRYRLRRKRCWEMSLTYFRRNWRVLCSTKAKQKSVLIIW